MEQSQEKRAHVMKDRGKKRWNRKRGTEENLNKMKWCP